MIRFCAKLSPAMRNETCAGGRFVDVVTQPSKKFWAPIWSSFLFFSEYWSIEYVLRMDWFRCEVMMLCMIVCQSPDVTKWRHAYILTGSDRIRVPLPHSLLFIFHDPTLSFDFKCAFCSVFHQSNKTCYMVFQAGNGFAENDIMFWTRLLNNTWDCQNIDWFEPNWTACIPGS